MSSTDTTWTDARVQRLKTLWEEGLSARQIATALGGVSRNAVIGKVHRLGLPGRVAGGKQISGSARMNRTNAAKAPKAAQFNASTRRRGNLAVALAPSPSARPVPVGLVAVEDTTVAEIVPMARYLMLVELTPTTCRWPIGNPTSPGFRFCGAPTQAGQSYCTACARKAYQAKGPRRSGDGPGRTG